MRNMTVIDYWFGRRGWPGTFELDEAHLDAFVGGYYHLALIDIGIGLLAEEALECL